MNPARVLLLVLGIVLVVVGIYMLYFAADLDRWVSMGVVTAGVLLVIGFAIMGFAGSPATTEGGVVRDREVHTEHHTHRETMPHERPPRP